MRTQVKEIRVGCHTIVPGSRVKIGPSQKGKHDGFESKVSALYQGPSGDLQVEVIDEAYRTRVLRPERIQWVPQGLRDPAGEVQVKPKDLEVGQFILRAIDGNPGEWFEVVGKERNSGRGMPYRIKLAGVRGFWTVPPQTKITVRKDNQ